MLRLSVNIVTNADTDGGLRAMKQQEEEVLCPQLTCIRLNFFLFPCCYVYSSQVQDVLYPQLFFVLLLE